jgi:hypothetical protein
VKEVQVAAAPVNQVTVFQEQMVSAAAAAVQKDRAAEAAATAAME